MIISFEKLSEIRQQHENIVLVGGCYDLLHMGHVRFLEKCRQHGDVLVVALSGDMRVAERKGKGRPIISQDKRAYMLNLLQMVDYVVIAPDPVLSGVPPTRMIINALRPDIFATNDPRFQEYETDLAAQKTQVVYVEPIPDDSTTDIIKRILERYCSDK